MRERLGYADPPIGQRRKDVWNEYVWPGVSTVLLMRPLHHWWINKAAHISEGEKVLEIGSGYPLYLFYSQEPGNVGFYVALDENSDIQKRSQKILDRLKRQEVNLVTADGNRLPFENESFDLVIVSNFNGPVGDFEYLEEMRRVLKSGSRALITVHEPFFIPLPTLYLAGKTKSKGFSEVKIKLGAPALLGWNWAITARK